MNCYPRPDLSKMFDLKLMYDPGRSVLSVDPTPVELFYASRYRNAEHIDIDTMFLHQLEMDIDAAWYELGLYDKRGCDYFGVTYTQTTSERQDTADMDLIEWVQARDSYLYEEGGWR